MKIIKFNILALIIMVILTTIFFNNHILVYAYNLSSFNLVDSGKHLDWTGSTKYSNEWSSAVNVWNNYKPGVIRPDTWYRVEDVSISDYYDPNSSTLFQISLSGLIKFNTYTIDYQSSNNKIHSVIMSIGYALGIASNTDINSVMCTPTPFFEYAITLDQDDKNAYDWLYNNQY